MNAFFLGLVRYGRWFPVEDRNGVLRKTLTSIYTNIPFRCYVSIPRQHHTLTLGNIDFGGVFGNHSFHLPVFRIRLSWQIDLDSVCATVRAHKRYESRGPARCLGANDGGKMSAE